MTLFPGADRRQWFQDDYPGAAMTPNVCVLHTTEGGSWPGYQGGATAPNITIKADKRRKRLNVRQHFPLNRSSRALRNQAGGVETNTLNVVQIELVGSCDRRDGYGAIYWPDAPEWCYERLGEFLATLHQVCPGIPLEATDLWLPYPSSYGNTRARMSFREWRSFRGICGHQHVPENSHGDPGDLPIATILAHARGEQEDDVTPQEINQVADRVVEKLLRTKLSGQHDAPAGRFVESTLSNIANSVQRLEAAVAELQEDRK